MKRVIFLIFGVIAFAWPAFCADDIKVEILSVWMKGPKFKIEVSVTNLSRNKLWWYYDVGASSIFVKQNVLYYAPNGQFIRNDYCDTSYDVKMHYVSISPGQEVKQLLEYDDSMYTKIIDLEKGVILRDEKQIADFKGIDFINLTLVFLKNKVTVPMGDQRYCRLVIKDGLVKSYMFRIVLKEQQVKKSD